SFRLHAELYTRSGGRLDGLSGLLTHELLVRRQQLRKPNGAVLKMLSELESEMASLSLAPSQRRRMGRICVTAVESNDELLEMLRARCNGLRGLSILKSNVESLHAPDRFYDKYKIGIHPPYDGVCIHNLKY